MWTVYKIVDKAKEKAIKVGITLDLDLERGRRLRNYLNDGKTEYAIHKIDEKESKVTALIAKETWELHLGLLKRYRKIDYRTIVALSTVHWLKGLGKEELMRWRNNNKKREQKVPCLICGKLVRRRMMLGHVANKTCIESYIRKND